MQAGYLYRATATPRMPITPARLPRSTAVGFGAPPVDVDEADAADAALLDSETAAVETADPKDDTADEIELTSEETAPRPATL